MKRDEVLAIVAAHREQLQELVFEGDRSFGLTQVRVRRTYAKLLHI
jgi:hypothetical protein